MTPRWTIALIGLLAACSAARMEMPADLQGARAMAVQGRQGWRINERISFGSYVASDVDRSWTRGSDFRFLVYTSTRRRRSYRFTLTESGVPKWSAECDSAFRERSAEVGGVEIEATNRSGLECRMRSSSDPADTWVLKLGEERERPMNGTLIGRGGALQVIGTNRVEGGIVPVEGASGYRIQHAGRAVAAIDVMNEGTVYLTNVTAGPPDLLAAASAALLPAREPEAGGLTFFRRRDGTIASASPADSSRS